MQYLGIQEANLLKNLKLICYRKVYVLASDFFTQHKWYVLDVAEQKWETYPSALNTDSVSFGKMINLRGSLYYFHDLAFPNQYQYDSMGSIYHIWENGTMIDLKMDEPFINEFDINDYGAFRIQAIQLAPFIRRIFRNVTASGINLKYTKYD